MTRYNCLKCPGYCCSHDRIPVSEFDIQRLARHFGLAEAEAKERFTYRHRTAEVDEQVLRHEIRSDRFTTLATLLESSSRPPVVEFRLPDGTRGLEYAVEVRAAPPN